MIITTTIITTSISIVIIMEGPASWPVEVPSSRDAIASSNPMTQTLQAHEGCMVFLVCGLGQSMVDIVEAIPGWGIIIAVLVVDAGVAGVCACVGRGSCNCASSLPVLTMLDGFMAPVQLCRA